MSIKKATTNTINKVLKPKRDEINQKTLDATYKAQKKYGFEIGTGQHATWNNEADAFKHAYMQWYMTWHYGETIAEKAGNYHEWEVPETISGETNMDKWNNQIGREIALEMLKIKKKKDWDILGEEYYEEYAAKVIYDKMQNGELITHPSDPRRVKNIDKERINPKHRVFTEDEVKRMGENIPDYGRHNYINDLLDGKGRPTVENLNKRVNNNELIYVDSYTKTDGTKVSGYYRRK